MTRLRISSENKTERFEVQLEEPFQVALPENPTTGYRWSLHEPAPEIVEIISSDYQLHSDSQIGGGGTRIITLRILQVGQYQVQLKRWREWEGENSVVERFQFTIQAH